MLSPHGDQSSKQGQFKRVYLDAFTRNNERIEFNQTRRHAERETLRHWLTRAGLTPHRLNDHRTPAETPPREPDLPAAFSIGGAGRWRVGGRKEQGTAIFGSLHQQFYASPVSVRDVWGKFQAARSRELPHCWPSLSGESPFAKQVARQGS